MSQGYELAEDELDVSLDQFRDQCGDGSGAVKYV
jgi:DNA-directed RNA polymerase I, II, and III subunit RPABC1